MQSTAVSSDPQTTPEAATAAAIAMAGRSAPQGMTSKIVNTNVVEINGFFIATVVVELVELEPEPEVAAEDDGGKEGSGESGSAKESNVTDAHTLALAAEANAMAKTESPLPDLAEAQIPVAPAPTPIIESMEQLPDPDHDLMNPEVPDTALGPDTLVDDAIVMAEEMRAEFNDQPEDLLVISKDGITPEQQASNEAHNQKALDAEEARREAAINNAAQAQEDLTPEPVS